MSNHTTTSRSYPPNYRNLGSQSPYPDPIQSCPGPTYPPQIDTHSKPNTYPAYDLNRHRSVSDASVTAPVLTMGNPAEREKARGEKANEGEYPEGWSREDEEAEREFLKAGMFNWTDMKNWRFWIRKEWWYWYVAAVILGVLVALMALFHDEIVEWLTPMANWMQKLPAGWVIPIVIIFILSFPPLFGQEIVAVLCGVVWGLWVGFGIVAAGTFFGEVGNFYAFKYWCRSRAEKYERNNLNYAIMAHVVREGGFFFIFVVRLSAIPGHFTTAVFATCGMGIIVFSLACILTLPKQLIVVYLGVLFKQKEKSQKSRIISWTVLVIGFLITIWAVWYCYKEMNKVKLVVWRKQRMALAAKGVSIDPVTGKRRPSYREDPLPLTQAQDEEEVLSPILQEHAQHAEAHYDADYHTAHPHHLFERRPSEADIAYNYGHHAPAPAHAFPEAHPAHQSYNIGRTHSTKSMHDHHLEAPIPTSFPVPGPAGVRTPDYSRRSSVQNASQHDQMSHDGPHGGQGYPDTLLSSGKGYHG